MVVSGVNDGPNLGDDVLYSGTVAAAIEGRFLGLPTIAVSLCTGTGGGGHFATGAEVARLLVAQLLRKPLESALILNVNVPDVPFAAAAGLSRHATRVPPSLRAGDARAGSTRAPGVLGGAGRPGARTPVPAPTSRRSRRATCQ